MVKILIIKLGYSETLDAEISRKSSLGDVLRTTVLLHAFKDDDVTWLVDEHAFPLLEGNPFIEQILIFDLISVLQLMSEEFDMIINFEKVPGICALAGKINAWKHAGFRFDSRKGVAKAYDGAEDILSMCLNINEKRTGKVYWQQALMEMIGKKWSGEEYILGYKPKSSEIFDVGFNQKVGKKWPNKAWPEGYWHELSDLLANKYTFSWQQGVEDIKDYIEWINSCRLIVTNDSLGLHIALALKKKVVALFGPTAHSEIYMYNRGVIVLPEKSDYDCLPCLVSTCVKERSCMYGISPEKVFRAIEDIWEGGDLIEKYNYSGKI